MTDPGSLHPVEGPSCPACGERSAPTARFCHACGTLLRSAAEAERRVVTVLFADLTGFTQLTEQLDAEDVRALISGCLDPLCEAVSRWGGFVDKFIGDCVMALFGAPVAYENEPERAVRAAVEMQQALGSLATTSLRELAERMDYRPMLRIGITTGPVVTGVFSGGGAHNYTAVGDSVNVAARLQGLCDPGEILVDEATYQQTRHIFGFGEEMILSVKGRSEPVHARYVRGVLSERRGIRGLDGRWVPLVGRDRELAGLRSRWRRVREGEATITVIAGPAGIGKSRLCHELIRAERIDAEEVARGRSYPYASATPWEPIGELLRDLYGIDPNLGAAQAVDAVVGTAGFEAPRTWTAERVAALGLALGRPVSEAGPLQGLDPRERTGLVAEAVIEAMRAAVGGLPRLLILEDLHWADRATLDFLGGLDAERLAAPILLLFLARPPLPGEEAVASLFDSTRDVLSLPALSEVDARELLEKLIEPHEVDGLLLERIADRSGGNPLFLEEIVKSLFDSGTLTREDDVCRAHGDQGLVQVPNSIESVLSTRIDRLGPEAKRVLQYAAIVGRRFWSGVLADALARRPVDQELSELERESLVRPQAASLVADSEEFLFEHLMLQEVAYDGLLKGMRAEWHGAVADWLSERLGASAEHAAWIAFHLERSTEPWRAVPLLERAAGTARESGALEDAERLIDRALVHVEDPTRRAELLGVAEEIASAAGRMDERLERIERLRELADSLEDERIAGDAECRLARLHVDSGDLSRARELCARALERFERLEDISLQGDALRLLGRIEHMWGRYPEAEQRYEAALSLETAAGDRAGQADIFDRLGLVEVDKDDFLTGLEHLRRARDLYAELGQRTQEARVLAHQAVAFRWLGALAEAERAAHAAIELAERSGSRMARLSARYALGMVRSVRGAEDGASTLEEVAHEAERAGRLPLAARAWLELAEAGRGEEFRQAAERALDLARRTGQASTEIRALTRLALLALEEEVARDADAHSADALERLRRHGNVQGPEEAVVYVRARVLQTLGRTEEAGRLAAEARRIIREKAERITDPAYRKAFLALAPNPQILASEVAAESSG